MNSLTLMFLLLNRSLYFYRGPAIYRFLHALAAKNFDQVMDLIESNTRSMIFIQGQSYTLLEWLASLPANLMQQRPRLNIARAWCLITQSHFSAA